MNLIIVQAALKGLQERRGLLPEDVAEMLNITTEEYLAIESGIQELSNTHRRILCQRF